ncbi:MAG: ferritin-like domain-containing protein [Chlamydiales bacterium]|nr:ferritin-like domain-containing protein [Chlamydiales bacterium]
MEAFLRYLIKDRERHVKWLNTLSYLENCGARKIAEAEHPTLVRREMLKHAAEEFRHAHYLKEQIKKLTPNPPVDYREIFGGNLTRRYLDRLEIAVCRLTDEMVYPLVTYAIEKRAEKLYPAYHLALKELRSKVTVMSIIKEEEGHLDEMERLLAGNPLKEKVCDIESALYESWRSKLCSNSL